MTEEPLSLWFVVATRNRPRELRRLVASLREQDPLPDGAVVVDASDGEPEMLPEADGPAMEVRHVRHGEPSAAAQRNRGVGLVPADADLIGFLDDDAVLEPGALRAMRSFWRSAPGDLGGAAFNLANHPPQLWAAAKRSGPLDALGVYPSRPGEVARSGWGGMHGRVERDRYVEWLPSGAAVWRREILEREGFDEFFAGYSYLEDLEFSYRVGREWRLAIVSDAEYRHLPAEEGRPPAYRFGRMEVRNRLYIVRKHGLSLPAFVLAMLGRMAVSGARALSDRDPAYLRRIAGNARQAVAEVLGEDGAARVAEASRDAGRGEHTNA